LAKLTENWAVTEEDGGSSLNGTREIASKKDLGWLKGSGIGLLKKVCTKTVAGKSEWEEGRDQEKEEAMEE